MLRALVGYITRAEALTATTAYAVVAGLLVAEVIGREFFGATFLGVQQLAVYAAILAGFLGLTLATSENKHLRPEALDFLTKRLGVQMTRLSDLVSSIFFFCCSAVSANFVLASMVAQDKAPVLYFHLWPLQLVIPYAFASSGLKHFCFFLRNDLRPHSG